MANICSFEMKIVGEKENVNKFLMALEQKGDLIMGRGAEITCDNDEDDNERYIIGWCKWSIYACLIHDAISMREQKKTGEGYWANRDGFIDNHDFITLIEATKIWNLEVEAVSWEGGCEFSEHYVINNGVMLVSEECVYQEIYDEETDEYIEVGGFEPLL